MPCTSPRSLWIHNIPTQACCRYCLSRIPLAVCCAWRKLPSQVCSRTRSLSCSSVGEGAGICVWLPFSQFSSTKSAVFGCHIAHVCCRWLFTVSSIARHFLSQVLSLSSHLVPPCWRQGSARM